MKYLKFFTIALLAINFCGCWSSEEKKNEFTEKKEAQKEIAKAVESPTDVEDVKEEFDKIKERLENHIKETESEDESKISDGKEIKPADGKTLSPTETLKEFDAATTAKSADRIEKVITKNSLSYFKKEAKKQGLTFKQMVEQPSQMPTVESPEMRNEKINGNKATVEAKNRVLGTFDKYPLVKEDGVWKVAYDVYLKQKLDELNKIVKQ